ncbi:PTS sugar transporter subunit IIA [Streptococcus suis]|uniref:PTS sugar transporter subunit IIA n=1 Tax=Streptococcus suis TaxID=1307 RepID=UPI000C18C45A|nr:PTS sugar transporter subunit IIA [Streptococcus suis]NQK54888.1 PTS sugar transporter subunit IIA [Streptococcus suis]HEM4073179.1 PTS sugar transporter subunit IIA [Streptococcus suis]HEM4670996.1 PTS sugar transporter subunit IIA [Streptococcus suis]HEM5208864.1 PTS sugar transporter subunit IIA [Streptococcus suis]HEM5235673.1 PTS sugar transporter subunit IIA [Streptococcus suis]
MRLLTLQQIFFQHFLEKEEVLSEIAALAEKLGIASGNIYDELKKREEEYSTAIGHGLAIPHAKTDLIHSPAILFFKLEQVIDWSGDEVCMIIAILTPRSEAGIHLSILSRLSRKLMHREFRERLEAAQTQQEVFDLFRLIEEEDNE